MRIPLLLALLVARLLSVEAFVVRKSSSVRIHALYSSQTSEMIAVSWTKPLGLILEEVVEGAAEGVFVKDIGEKGAAAGQTQLIGSRLAEINGVDVQQKDFDSIMNALVAAPTTVSLTFVVDRDSGSAPTVDYDIGTPVSIVVKQPNGDDLTIQAKVGDNLRQTLLDAGFEVYQGLKQKLGNCGGAGQCTFCAVDFLESDGWLERSDYEDQKLKKFPKARLSCLNNIQGPATIQKTQR